MTDHNLGHDAKIITTTAKWVRNGLTGLSLASALLVTALSVTACADNGNQINTPVKDAEAKIENPDKPDKPTDKFDLDAFLEADIAAGAADVARAKQETAREKQETARTVANLAREKQETAAAKEIRRAAEKAEDPSQ